MLRKITINVRNVQNTLFTGKVLHHLEKINSTNAYVQTLLSNTTPPDGLVVFTDEQYAGRGQLGTIWLSEPRQNIICSILYYPVFLPASKIFYLNKAVTVAIRDFIASFLTQDVFIKWPNDILVNGKKIAGILLETAIQADCVKQAVIGMGINVNQTEFDATIPNATSMQLMANTYFDLPFLLDALCVEIEKNYLDLKNTKLKLIDEKYSAHLLGLNKKSEFKTADMIFEGTIKGVNENGKLMIEKENKIFEYGIKEVEMTSPGLNRF